MTTTIAHPQIIKAYPTYLWFLILAFSMALAMANWFDARLIALFGMPVSPGSLIFPVTLLLSDIITEVYGYKQARLAIWAAFVFNIIFILFGQLIISLPSPIFAPENDAFDRLLSINARIVIASIVSYFLSEPINAYIMARAKVIANGKYIGIRFISSTVVSSFIDSIFFVTIAFYGIYENIHLFHMMFNIWIIKTMVEIFLLPFSTRVAMWLKRKEQVDIYDYDTKFNLFNYDIEYSAQNNRYLG